MDEVDYMDYMDLVSRDVLIERGIVCKREMPGLSDMQILSILEVHYIVDMCSLVEKSHPFRDPFLQLLELVFEGFKDEILAQPPTLAFGGLPVTSAEGGPASALAEQAFAAIKSMRASRINVRNTSGESSTKSAETPAAVTESRPKASSDSNIQADAVEASARSSTAPVKMTEVNITVGSHNKAQVRPVKPSAPSTETPISIAEVNAIFSSNTKAQERGVQSSGASSRAPSNMTKAKSTVDYNRKSQADTVKSSTSSTKAGPNWQQSDSEDPFGLRVSTEEFGTEPAPFDIALGKFHNTRDNIMYLGGYRDATAHFEELVPQIIQPLKPGVDLTPEPVKVFMAANTTRKEAAEAEMKATKAKELDVVRAQEIATASGLHEQFKNPVPTFGQTMGIAVANAKLEPTSAGAYSKLSNESMREIYEGLKGKGKDFTSVSMEEEEALGKSGVHRCADATTEEDEAPAKGWIHPVADRVIDNAQMQYDMMYGIVTQLQRDRLELGPEVSDYEVIATAHASYVAADKAEADALARAAEIQRAKALSDSVSDELRRAQKNGLAITKIAGLELTQKDIADVLERCSQVGGSSSAATDYINSKKTALKAFHTDPFTNPSDLNPTSATAPFSATDLLTAASASLPEHSAPDHFTAAAEKIEHDLQAMKAFRGRIGTTPRDFSAEIAEIETELAELKAHRAKAPGDLVRDSVDGLGGGDESIAGELEEEEAEEAAEVAEGVEGGKKEGKKGKSRAEQRRVAREKKKGKGRE